MSSNYNFEERKKEALWDVRFVNYPAIITPASQGQVDSAIGSYHCQY